jgi:hypothetical protein
MYVYISVYITSDLFTVVKNSSHVLLSIQFDTIVSQLLCHVLPWSCDPLPSLGELSSSSLNGLSVCLSCLFDCVSYQWCPVDIYCTSVTSEWPCFQRFFFFIAFPKKNGLSS